MLRLEESTGARRTGDGPCNSVVISISASMVMVVVE